MKRVFLHSFETKMGKVHTAATEKGLAVVSLPGGSSRAFRSRVKSLFSGWEVKTGGSVNREAERQIKSYLSGKLTKFRLPLNIMAGPFRQKVLKRVARIPYGQTMTYGQIARAIGHPRACRAVGGANGANDLPLVIPCHRVVAANGPGGFAGGLEMKKKLLRLEKAL